MIALLRNILVLMLLALPSATSVLAQEQIETARAQLVQDISRAIAWNLYSFEFNKLEDSVSPFLVGNASIVGLVIIDQSRNQEVLQFYRKDEQLIFGQSLPDSVRQMTSRTIPVTHENETIGSIRAYFDTTIQSDTISNPTVDQKSAGQALAEKIAKFSTKAIYNLDEDQLVAVLEGYLNDHSEIAGLEIIESLEYETLLSYHRDAKGKQYYDQPLPPNIRHLTVYEAVSRFQDEDIGRVLVYVEQQSSLNLTADERRWLAENPVISVGVEEWYPFIRLESNGEPGGIAGDFLHLVQEKTGLTFRVVNGQWPGLLSSFRDGNIDLLPATYYTDERATYGLYGDPYFTGKEFLYTRDDNTDIRSFADLKGKKIAIPEDFGTIPKVREKFPDIEIVETKDLRASIYAVLNGDVDATLESQIVMNDIIRRELISGLKAIAQTDFDTSGLYFFSHKDKPLLQSILKKALNDISVTENRAIIDKWVTSNLLAPPTDPELSSAPAEPALVSLPVVIAMGAGLLILFGIIIYMLGRLRSERDLSSFFGATSFRVSILVGLTILVLAVVLMNWVTIEDSKKRTTTSLENELKLVLTSSVERLNTWVLERERYINQLGRDPELVAITKELLAVTPVKSSLATSDALQRARDYFAANDKFGSAGFFIISPNLTSIGSRRDANIGSQNFIADLRPDLIQRAFAGEAVFVPPMRSDVELESGQKKPLSMFFAAPITDVDGTVLAVMTERINPTGPLSKILRLGRTGLSGETYAFNAEGKMISKSRFQRELVEIGLLPEGNAEATELSLADPGVNLTQLPQKSRSLKDRPFTLMVQQALEQRRNGTSRLEYNTDGYRDYRGVSVVGAWEWLEALDIGIATEVDVSEALEDHTEFRFNMLVVTLVATSMAIGATLFTLILGQRSHRSLSRARDQLEHRVIERTRELQNSEKRIRSIIDNAADGIIVISARGYIQSFSPAAEIIFAYKADDVIGKKINMLMPEPYHSEHDGYLQHYEETGQARIIGRNREVTGKRKDGTEFPMDLAVGKTVLGDETIYTGIVRDISIRKEAEAALQDAYDVISSSIDYASNIQRAVLTGEAMMAATTQDYFVWWEPRDVVGGDIYWCHMWGDSPLIISADCTGHGVPGAFMTLISTGALDRAMTEIAPGNVGALIQRMHQIIQFTLNQHGADGLSDDGLDLGACHVSSDTNKIVFAGARTSLFISDGKKIQEIKGTKSSIGYRQISPTREFEESIVDITEEDLSFYMLTDGFFDQIGGPRRRMFGKKRFREILLDNFEQPLAVQRDKLQQALKEYQGEETRRDDVTVVGFKPVRFKQEQRTSHVQAGEGI